MNDGVFSIRAAGADTGRHAIIDMKPDDDLYNLRDARTGIHRTSVNLNNLIRVERVATPSSGTRDLQLALVNSCFVLNKTADIRDYVVSNNIDIVLLTETWLTSSDAVKRADVIPDGIRMTIRGRPAELAVGLVFCLKSGTKCKVVSSGELDSIEYVNYELICQKTNVDVHVIYRPPYSEKHHITTATFFEEFQTYLSQAVQITHSLEIAGDFNINMDTDTDADKIRICDVLSMYDITQHVTVPTHVSGHTLDLIISRYILNFCLVAPRRTTCSDDMFPTICLSCIWLTCPYLL